MHTKIFSATTIGVQAHPVEVEVDLSFGLLNFHIVGLPDVAIKESRQRITTALKNSGIRLPERKITVNLAPADLKKEGTLFDLPIAIGILQAAQQLQLTTQFLQETLFIGELSLDGAIRTVKGTLAIAYDAQRLGKKRIVVPHSNAPEAALIQGLEVIGVNHLTELVSMLRNEQPIRYIPATVPTNTHPIDCDLDFAHVKGQMSAKRALQIAAAGHHNILFIGPPGSGKTMLAQRLATIMPPLSFSQILETSKIYSVSGKLADQTLITQRPFRNPHHTISAVGLVGGGSFPQPGEMSLAHNGILFLDELTEFKRSSLEVLRQPLEDRVVNISRAQYSVQFPASCLLVAALNPCPCGFLGDPRKTCHCSAPQINRYLEKLSGPLLDRIDLQINVQPLDYQTVTSNQSTQQSSQELYHGVETAIKKQAERFAQTNGYNGYNGTMPASQIDEHCKLTDSAQEIIKRAFEKLHLSMRGYHKLLRVARTIADLEDTEIIDAHHIREAIMYRSLDQYMEQIKQK